MGSFLRGVINNQTDNIIAGKRQQPRKTPYSNFTDYIHVFLASSLSCDDSSASHLQSGRGRIVKLVGPKLPVASQNVNFVLEIASSLQSKRTDRVAS